MKTLNIEDETWKKLFRIKLEKLHKTIDETINYILDNRKEDVK